MKKIRSIVMIAALLVGIGSALAFTPKKNTIACTHYKPCNGEYTELPGGVLVCDNTTDPSFCKMAWTGEEFIQCEETEQGCLE